MKDKEEEYVALIKAGLGSVIMKLPVLPEKTWVRAFGLIVGITAKQEEEEELTRIFIESIREGRMDNLPTLYVVGSRDEAKKMSEMRLQPITSQSPAAPPSGD